MKIVERTQNETHTDRLTIEGGEVRKVRYSRDGKTYRVSVVRVDFERSGKTEWLLRGVEISGPKLRKDGSDGDMWASESFRRSSTLPAWLYPLVNTPGLTAPEDHTAGEENVDA